jgi:hypothetical protein
MLNNLFILSFIEPLRIRHFFLALALSGFSCWQEMIRGNKDRGKGLPYTVSNDLLLAACVALLSQLERMKECSD